MFDLKQDQDCFYDYPLASKNVAEIYTDKMVLLGGLECGCMTEWVCLPSGSPSFAPDALPSCRERANASLSCRHGLALFGPVPVQSRFGRELQFLFQAKHLGAVHTHLFLQLPLLPQLQDALILSRLRGPPDKPLQVVAHRSHHEGHREGDIRGIGP